MVSDGLTWTRPEPYFRVDGKPAFVFGRNPAGWRADQFSPLITWAHESGERIIRIHLGLPRESQPGVIYEPWVEKWETVLDEAAAHDLYVLPVFSAWARWNDGSDGRRWSYWNQNPYNVELGGPAKTPSELYADTECRQLWLRWLGEVVRRWRSRPNIVGWELFSELNLVTGATEEAGLRFVREASRVVREMDPAGRPVTASLAGIGEWPRLFADDAIDWIQVHPYADSGRHPGQLDRMIINSVRQRAKRYGKPVFIGESGLDSGPPQGTLDSAERAEVGLRHAFWAAMVSGAMNGRMLWWGDGYDVFQKPDPELRKRFALLARPAADFARTIDRSGFEPVRVWPTPELYGAAIGQKRKAIAWFRDAQCIPPKWPTRRLAGQQVRLGIPGQAGCWRVAIHDPVTLRLLAELEADREEGHLPVVLPEFEDSIVLELTAVEPEEGFGSVKLRMGAE